MTRPELGGVVAGCLIGAGLALLYARALLWVTRWLIDPGRRG